MNKEQEDRLWVLLAKQHSGEASAAELTELQELLIDKGVSAKMQEKLQAMWRKPLKSEYLDTAGAWEQLQHQRYQKKLRRLKNTWWAVAAAVLAIATTGLIIYTSQHGQQLTVQQVFAEKGIIQTDSLSKTKTTLADGTVVWLHRGSLINYRQETYGKQHREVTLTGEAFFDVAKNEQLPFVVHAGAVVVQAKGTAFNVKAYPGTTVETVLVSGAVEVYDRKNPTERVLLQPNEKIHVPLQQEGEWTYSVSRIEKEGDQPLDETVWIAHSLSFDNEPLETLAPKLESWYNITIQFTNEQVKNRRFSAVIANETLRETLDAMKLSYPFHYRIEQNVVWIGSSGTDSEQTN